MAAIRHRPGRPVRGSTVAIGADVGGTWVRVVMTQCGSKPPLRLAVRATRVRDLRTFFGRLWKAHGWTRTEVGALVVASRGIWTATECRVVAHRLRALARRVRVVSDAQAALLGALDERPGVLVLSGTGSIVIGRDDAGRWARAGGMGPLLGDEGSAFWLGREWLRVTTAGEDFFPARPLVHSADPVASIAALAPRVLRSARRGDRRARRIVKSGQACLAAWTRDVARRLRLVQPVALSWAGSVLDDPWFRAGLKAAVRRTGLKARWQNPARSPVEAAARLAERLATPRGMRRE